MKHQKEKYKNPELEKALDYILKLKDHLVKKNEILVECLDYIENTPDDFEAQFYWHELIEKIKEELKCPLNHKK